MITIRQANIEDAASISELGRKTFEESYGAFFNNHNTLADYLNLAFNIEKIANSLAKPENIYWVVHNTIKEAPIGYAKLKLNVPSEFITGQNTCKLQRIYLLQGFEGQGIGSTLHKYILKTVIDKGCTSLWLSNLKLKDQAVQFYKNKGYRIAGEHKFTIGNETFDFWAMYIRLN